MLELNDIPTIRSKKEMSDTSTVKPRKQSRDISAIKEQAMSELYAELKNEMLADLKFNPEVLATVKELMKEELKKQLLDDIAKGKWTIEKYTKEDE